MSIFSSALLTWFWFMGQSLLQLATALNDDCLTFLKVKVTLRLTASQSVSLGVEPHLEHLARYLLLFDSYAVMVFFFVGRPPWQEDGSVFCICCWALPEQSVLGPSPLGLVTIFYCLRFETSLFVTSYDSQGHGGGIRPCLHMGISPHSLSESESCYDQRSVGQSVLV
jgi:hypothetical protein